MDWYLTQERLRRKPQRGVIVPHGDHYHFIPYSQMSPLEEKISRMIGVNGAGISSGAQASHSQHTPTQPNRPVTPIGTVTTQPVSPTQPVLPTQPKQSTGKWFPIWDVKFLLTEKG